MPERTAIGAFSQGVEQRLEVMFAMVHRVRAGPKRVDPKTPPAATIGAYAPLVV